MLDAKHVYDIVQANEQVVSPRPDGGRNKYLPADLLCSRGYARRLTTGMEIQACPSYVSREEYGYMYGYIESIGDYPVTDSDIEAAVGSRQYVADILGKATRSK